MYSLLAVRRRWKVKTLLAGPQPYQPYEAEVTNSPISKICWKWQYSINSLLDCKVTGVFDILIAAVVRRLSGKSRKFH